MPKSESTGCPYAVSRMLDGLMSRCSTPARWADSTALPILIAMRSTSGTGIRSRRYRSLSDARAELHHQVRPAVGRDARLVDREDRRMRRQLRHEVGLRLEHLTHLVVDDFAQHDLDRDLASRHVLLVQEHVGEAPGAEHVNVRKARQDRGLRG